MTRAGWPESIPLDMGNVLSDDKKQQVLALGRLGWSLFLDDAPASSGTFDLGLLLRRVTDPEEWKDLDDSDQAK